MYHAIVERISRRNFELVNNHQDEALLRSCLPTITHRFGGSHALGGQRNDIDGLRCWFIRLHHLCPTLRLSVTDVWVKGLPQDTTIIIRWTATQDDTTRRRHRLDAGRRRTEPARTAAEREDGVCGSAQGKAPAASWTRQCQDPAASVTV